MGRHRLAWSRAGPGAGAASASPAGVSRRCTGADASPDTHSPWEKGPGGICSAPPHHPHHTTWHHSTQHHAVPHCMAPHGPAPHGTMLSTAAHCITLCHMAPHGTARHSTVPRQHCPPGAPHPVLPRATLSPHPRTVCPPGTTAMPGPSSNPSATAAGRYLGRAPCYTPSSQPCRYCMREGVSGGDPGWGPRQPHAHQLLQASSAVAVSPGW